jgi:hypothetical protein
MTHRPSHGYLAAVAFVGALVCIAVSLGQTFGSFTQSAANSGNNFASASDYRAPTINRSVIAKTAGGIPGYIRQGGTYYVYADLTDTGNPASGISSVTSNSSTITTGATATALSSGSFSIGGLGYSHRTTSLTANSTLAAGTYSYTVSSTDAAGNSGSQSYTVTVDNAAPSGTDIQTANGGSIAGRPEQNDTITYTFSEPIDPDSILAGWTGTATNVVVRINNNTPTNDQVQIFNSTNASQLPLGNLNLGRTDYVVTNRTFGASGTASSMTMSGNSITIVLGTQSGPGTTAASTATTVWTPSATATDWAGNAASTTNTSETGTADREF